jgi:hypothetical protein
LRGVPIDASLEFDSADDRQQDRPRQRCHPGGDYVIPVAQTDGDIGIQ